MRVRPSATFIHTQADSKFGYMSFCSHIVWFQTKAIQCLLGEVCQTRGQQKRSYFYCNQMSELSFARKPNYLHSVYKRYKWVIGILTWNQMYLPNQPNECLYTPFHIHSIPDNQIARLLHSDMAKNKRTVTAGGLCYPNGWTCIYV